MYPFLLCKAISSRFRNQLRVDHRLHDGIFGLQDPEDHKESLLERFCDESTMVGLDSEGHDPWGLEDPELNAVSSKMRSPDICWIRSWCGSPGRRGWPISNPRACGTRGRAPKINSAWAVRPLQYNGRTPARGMTPTLSTGLVLWRGRSGTRAKRRSLRRRPRWSPCALSGAWPPRT